MDKETIIVLLLLLIGSLAISARIGHQWHAEVMQKRAVEAGHAEFVLDPKTGETTWRWK